MESNVLEFKGHPVEGDYQVFVDALINDGFTIAQTTDYGVVLNGHFIGYDIEITVVFTPKTKQVVRLCINFPKRLVWLILKMDYEKVVELYKKKYEVKNHFETFNSPYKEGDGKEEEAVSRGESHYATIFVQPIMIVIDPFMRLYISYENPTNAQLYKDEQLEMSLKEI